MKSISDSMPVVMHIAPGFQASDARLFHQECSTLKKAGYRVELVAHPKAGQNCESAVDFYSLGILEYSSWRWRLLDRLNRSRKAYWAARKSSASIFHIHSPWFARWGVRLKNSTHKQLIFDFREDYEGFVKVRPGVPHVLRNPLAALVRKHVQWAARNADAVIVADERTGDLLRSSAKRIVVLHNFPRLDLFPYKEQREEEIQYDIVHHGSAIRLQLQLCLGIDDALAERGRLIRWRFITKDDPDLDWLAAEAERRNALSRFTIEKMMPHDKVSEEVRKARIGISLFTSHRKFQNNVPRKIFEFMALGMPVVLADLPPTRRFVQNGVNGFAVPADDCGAFAEAISRLLDDPALRRRMGAAGRKTVETSFNWETESEKLLNLYTDLLKQSAADFNSVNNMVARPAHHAREI